MLQTERFRLGLPAYAIVGGAPKSVGVSIGCGEGNLGDHRAIGQGLSEMRIDEGPGYRVYFVERGRALIILLCGGDKDSQRRDIELARKLAEEN